MASTYLSRTLGTATNRKKFTISLWFKKVSNSGTQQFLDTRVDSNNQDGFKIHSSQALKINGYESSTTYELQTNAILRDISAWYHAVVSFDSTQSTSTDRLKMYLNGEQITSFSGATYPSLNFEPLLNKNIAHFIGSTGNSNYFDGYMNNFVFVDGTALTPSSFGETDSTSGIWKFKSPSGVTFGNNGFHLKFDNSANLGLDSSGETNNFTLSGNGRQAKDTPTNVFATLNTLERLGGSITVSNGNTQFFNQASDWRTIISNLAFPNTGKFYAEMQVNEVSSAVQVGIMAQSSFVSHFQADLGTQGQYNSYAYLNTGQKRTNNSASNYGGSFSGGIIGIAVDMDNKNIYFSKDGVWQDSGNPESGATGTGAAFTDLQIDKDYCFAVASQGSNPKVSWNFGNGYFGTTAISSAGSNGNGSLFEFDVPSGYYALNTKNINTYG